MKILKYFKVLVACFAFLAFNASAYELNSNNISMYHSVLLNSIKYSGQILLKYDFKERKEEFEKNFEGMPIKVEYSSHIAESTKLFNHYKSSLEEHKDLYSADTYKQKQDELEEFRENLVYAIAVINHYLSYHSHGAINIVYSELNEKELNSTQIAKINNFIYKTTFSGDDNMALLVHRYQKTLFLAAVINENQFNELMQKGSEYEKEFFIEITKGHSFADVRKAAAKANYDLDGFIIDDLRYGSQVYNFVTKRMMMFLEIMNDRA